MNEVVRIEEILGDVASFGELRDYSRALASNRNVWTFSVIVGWLYGALGGTGLLISLSARSISGVLTSLSALFLCWLTFRLARLISLWSNVAMLITALALPIFIVEFLADVAQADRAEIYSILYLFVFGPVAVLHLMQAQKAFRAGSFSNQGELRKHLNTLREWLSKQEFNPSGTPLLKSIYVEHRNQMDTSVLAIQLSEGWLLKIGALPYKIILCDPDQVEIEDERRLRILVPGYEIAPTLDITLPLQ